MASMIIPSYEPTPYAFTSITLSSVPPTSRALLTAILPNIPPLIPTTRISLVSDLVQRLLPIHLAIIHHHHGDHAHFLEVAEPPSSNLGKSSTRQLRNIPPELLSKREQILSDFTFAFDALVWLEVQCVPQTGSHVSAEEIRGYRDALLLPYVGYINGSLQEVEKIVKDDATADPYIHEYTSRGAEKMEDTIGQIEPIIAHLIHGLELTD